MSDTNESNENEFLPAGDEIESKPVDKELDQKKPGLSFMARKRRHMLILLGGRAPKVGP
jgi:hypothetical protein